ILSFDHAHQMTLDQRVKKFSHIASYDIDLHTVVLGKHVKNLANTTRLYKQTPNLLTYSVEPKISARTNAQKNNVVLYCRRKWFLIPNQDHVCIHGWHVCEHRQQIMKPRGTRIKTQSARKGMFAASIPPLACVCARPTRQTKMIVTR